ncbi:MAG: ATP-grasp domain-containing protein [Rhodocyclaceae bacterium]|jgi:hypothetical protein|nr:ATP-grasp domain-containing protein [Rhodocyclaceae bacterium]
MVRVWYNKTFSSVHSALTLIRKGDIKGEYQVCCSHPQPKALGLLVADEAAAEPAGVTGQEYVDWCLAFCKAQRIDIFVPGKEATLMARHQDLFLEQGVRLMSAATPETLELLHDKARFYATVADDPGLSPECAVFECADSFEAAYARMRAQHEVLCIKPSVSVYGIGFRQITEQKSAFDLLLDGNPYRIDLRSLREMLQRAGTFRPMLLMPFLAGHEFSVDCVAAEGALVCAVARRKSLVAGGGQQIVVRADIDAACARLIARFRLNGNVNIQFREGDEGLRVLEINPRMSGGIGMACLAGPNLPYIGLVTFDRGVGAVSIPPVEENLHVGELNQAVRLS